MQTLTTHRVSSPLSHSETSNAKQTIYECYTEDLCKFCFQTEKQSQEKLISPCGCSGSLKYVHKQCLQKWLSIEANRRDGPLADISFKLRRPNLKCKLCEKDIIFEKELTLLSQILAVFHWITIFYFIKKLKYYACISILGSLAINYYFMKFFFEKIYNISVKIKDNSIVSLIVLSLVLILLEQTFIEVKWNQNNLELSIPFLSNK